MKLDESKPNKSSWDNEYYICDNCGAEAYKTNYDGYNDEIRFRPRK